MPKGRGYMGGEPTMKKIVATAGMVAATSSHKSSVGKTIAKGKTKSMKKGSKYK